MQTTVKKIVALHQMPTKRSKRSRSRSPRNRRRNRVSRRRSPRRRTSRTFRSAAAPLPKPHIMPEKAKNVAYYTTPLIEIEPQNFTVLAEPPGPWSFLISARKTHDNWSTEMVAALTALMTKFAADLSKISLADYLQFYNILSSGIPNMEFAIMDQGGTMQPYRVNAGRDLPLTRTQLGHIGPNPAIDAVFTTVHNGTPLLVGIGRRGDAGANALAITGGMLESAGGFVNCIKEMVEEMMLLPSNVIKHLDDTYEPAYYDLKKRVSDYAETGQPQIVANKMYRWDGEVPTQTDLDLLQYLSTRNMNSHMIALHEPLLTIVKEEGTNLEKLLGTHPKLVGFPLTCVEYDHRNTRDSWMISCGIHFHLSPAIMGLIAMARFASSNVESVGIRVIDLRTISPHAHATDPLTGKLTHTAMYYDFNSRGYVEHPIWVAHSTLMIQIRDRLALDLVWTQPAHTGEIKPLAAA